MRAGIKLLMVLVAAVTCTVRADGPAVAPAPASPAGGLHAQPPAPPGPPGPPGDTGRPRWPGPIDGNRAPVFVLDLGARLVACPDGTVAAAAVDISGLRYELTEACRGTAQRGHIEISGIAGQKAADHPEEKTTDRTPGGTSPPQHPGEPGRNDASAPSPLTRCDPATWNCTPAKR